MKYQCYLNGCGKQSTSNVKCTACDGVFLTPDRLVEVDDRATGDLIHDLPTQEELGRVLVRSRRAGVGKDKSAGGTAGQARAGNGAAVADGQPKQAVSAAVAEYRDLKKRLAKNLADWITAAGKDPGAKEVRQKFRAAHYQPIASIPEPTSDDRAAELVAQLQAVEAKWQQANGTPSSQPASKPAVKETARQEQPKPPPKVEIQGQTTPEKTEQKPPQQIKDEQQVSSRQVDALVRAATLLVKELLPSQGKDALTPYLRRAKQAQEATDVGELEAVLGDLQKLAVEAGLRPAAEIPPSTEEKTEQKPPQPIKDVQQVSSRQVDSLVHAATLLMQELMPSQGRAFITPYVQRVKTAKETIPPDVGGLETVLGELKQLVVKARQQVDSLVQKATQLLKELLPSQGKTILVPYAQRLQAVKAAPTPDVGELATIVRELQKLAVEAGPPEQGQVEQEDQEKSKREEEERKQAQDRLRKEQEDLAALQQQAQQRKTAIEQLAAALPAPARAPFVARAETVRTTAPIDLAKFGVIEQEVNAAILALQQQAQQRKTAIEQLAAALPAPARAQYIGRAETVRTTAPIDLAKFAAIEQEVNAAILALQLQAQEKKAAIEQLLLGLPVASRTPFTQQAEAARTTAPIDLAKFGVIEQEINAAIFALQEQAQLRKTAIEQLLLGLPVANDRQPFAQRAEAVRTTAPIDLAKFDEIEQEVNAAILALQGQPQTQEVQQKIDSQTNSPEERQILLGLPAAVANSTANLLETLAQQRSADGIQFANLAEASAALRTANQTIADGPSKQFQDLYDSLLALRTKLVDLKAYTAAEMRQFLTGPAGNLTIAKQNFAVNPAVGLKQLKETWDQLKNQRPEATSAVQSDPKWQNYDAEQRAIDEAERIAAAARPLAALDGCIRFGPLAKGSAGKLSDEDASKIIASYKDNPQLADYAMDLALRGQHPEVIARGLEVVVAARTKMAKDVTPEVARKRERQALELGCKLGGDYFDRMEAYYATNAPTQPRLVNAAGTGTQKGMAYTRAMAANLVGATGAIDFNQAGGVLNDLNFHPKSLDDPLPSLAVTIDEFRKEVAARPQEYKTVLDAVNQPTEPTVENLVRHTLGKTGDVTANDAKQAVLSAMLTPVDQGDVGSCHVDGPCIKFRANRPLDVMTDLKDILKDGTLTKNGRPPVPVITNIDDKENKLLRSWEYTVATTAMRLTNNESAMRLSDKLFVNYTGHDPAGRLSGLEDSVTQSGVSWDAAQQAMKAELSRSFQYKYNPTAQLAGGTASDGSSGKGRWELLHVDPSGTETVVTHGNNYRIRMRDAVVRALTSLNVSDDAKTTANNIIVGDEFLNNLKLLHQVKEPPPNNENGMPWKKDGGGDAVYENQVLFGGNPQKQDLFVNTAATPPLQGQGPQAQPYGPDTQEYQAWLQASQKQALLTPTGVLLAGIAAKILPPAGVEMEMDPGKDFVSLGVHGVHDMNLMRGHPSLQPLRGATPAEVEQNVKQLLVDRGREIATTPLKPDRLNYLLDKALDTQVGELLGRDGPGLTESQNRPAGEMTPAQFKQQILAKSNARIDAMVSRDLGANPTFTAATLKTSYQQQLTAKIDALLIKELDYPEFVFADTNWGNPEYHKLLVASCDPSTGEPKMYEKKEFTGEYSSAKDWIDKQWQAVQ